MAEKHLTEAGWKQANNKKSPPPLGPLLVAYGKLGKDDLEERHETLTKISKEARKQQLTLKNSKPQAALHDYLGEIDKEAGVVLKQVEADLKAEVEKAEADESVDPVALKKRLIALMGQIRRPAAPGALPYAFMVGAAGSEARILLSRKVGNAQREVLKEMLPKGGTPKYFSGTCIWEAELHTFVVQKVPGGLARQIAKALHAETAVKYRVRVRSADGQSVADSETEAEQELPDDAGEAPEAPAPPAAAGSPQAEFVRLLKLLKPDLEKVLAGAVPASDPTRKILDIIVGFTKTGNYPTALTSFPRLQEHVQTGLRQLSEAALKAEDPGELFKQRLTAALPRIREAIAAGGPAAAELKLRASEAGTLAKQRNFPEAQRVLDGLEQWLKPTTQPTPPAEAVKEGDPETEPPVTPVPPPEPPPAPEPAQPSEKARLAEISIQWQRDRSYVQGEVDRVAEAMRAALQKEPDFGAMQGKIGEFASAFGLLNDRLTAKLDEALQTSPENQAKLRGEAGGIVAEYLAMVTGGSWFLRGLEDNPFSPTGVQPYLKKSLPALAQTLADAA